jgi:GrpB-like predicted nucleotidyltransferase (UPF0157 family)
MKVKLEKHNPQWKSFFEIEKKRLFNVLDTNEVKIKRIGSTSISYICSKPIIDMLIGVKKEKQLDININSIIPLGYTYVQKYEIYMPFRRYFFKPENPDIQFPKIIGFNDPDINKENQDSFHIHMVKINSDFWINHLLFRNYPRNNYKARKEYVDIKKSLKKIFDFFGHETTVCKT